MAAEAGADVHHGAPRCLLGRFDAAAGVLADWSVFDAEAERLSIEVRGLSREDVSRLIESSTYEIPTPEHRRLHHRKLATSCGGAGAEALRTLALYGRPYFSLLARFRWGRATLEALTRHRAGSLKGAGCCDPLSRV